MTELRDSWADAETSPVRLGLECAVFPRGASLLSSHRAQVGEAWHKIGAQETMTLPSLSLGFLA